MAFLSETITHFTIYIKNSNLQGSGLGQKCDRKIDCYCTTICKALIQPYMDWFLQVGELSHWILFLPMAEMNLTKIFTTFFVVLRSQFNQQVKALSVLKLDVKLLRVVCWNVKFWRQGQNKTLKICENSSNDIDS